MKFDVYTEIVDCFHRDISRKRHFRLNEFANHYPSVSKHTLGSICSLEYQKLMKKTNYKYHEPHFVEEYYCRFMDDINCGKKHVLLNLAEEVHLSPALFARNMLERHLSVTEYDGDAVPKPVLTRLMKDTSLVRDPVLANEIDVCILNDEFYGPIMDGIRHSIGHEYEFLLKRKADENKLVYLDEDQMRGRGYDKTPDIKLEVPIAVDGRVVNWIESKASFGDEISHKRYLKEQFWSYWNRFGPGLVIYWFGFIDELDTHRDKGIMLMDHFPEKISFMDTGYTSSQ